MVNYGEHTGGYPTVPEWTELEYLSAILVELRKLNEPPKVQYVPAYQPSWQPPFQWQSWN